MNKIFNKIKNLIFKNRYPSFTRVYSYDDLPRESGDNSMWHTVNINDKVLLEKIYHHISTSSNIYYYCSDVAIECAVKTKKFGWCLLVLRPTLCFTEFGVWKNNTRYDINYSSELEECKPLYKFLSDFYEKASKEYKKDLNL